MQLSGADCQISAVTFNLLYELPNGVNSVGEIRIRVNYNVAFRRHYSLADRAAFSPSWHMAYTVQVWALDALRNQFCIISASVIRNNKLILGEILIKI